MITAVGRILRLEPALRVLAEPVPEPSPRLAAEAAGQAARHAAQAQSPPIPVAVPFTHPALSLVRPPRKAEGGRGVKPMKPSIRRLAHGEATEGVDEIGDDIADPAAGGEVAAAIREQPDRARAAQANHDAASVLAVLNL